MKIQIDRPHPEVPLSESRYYYPNKGEEQVQVRLRLLFAGLSLLALIGFGVVGYYILGQGQWTLWDCAFMVLITITTVGYGEILPITEVEGGRLFTMVLLVSGMGMSLYFLSSLTAFIVEGDLGEVLWRRRMKKRADGLSDHYIVCGAGETGRAVVEALTDSGRQVVVIELKEEHLDRLSRRLGDAFVGILGDATEDSVLLQAGIERAHGAVATLQTDRDNLFMTISARQLNKGLRIVSRAIDERAHSKLRHAGANSVISPNSIGGRRMANELIRPGVVSFIDGLAGSADTDLTVEECPIPIGSHLEGLSLARSGIRQVGNVLVLSVLQPDGTHTFNPESDFVLQSDMVLVVLGEGPNIEKLRAYAKRPCAQRDGQTS